MTCLKTVSSRANRPFATGSLTAAALVLGLSLATSSGCGATYESMGTSTAVGADATFEVDELDGGNLMVDVHITNLPPPQRLEGSPTTYAVWVIPSGQSPSLAGFLDYDEDDREGSMKATTVHRKFEIRVTAEKNRNVAAPSSTTVARQKVDEAD
jgi:hypothetical protein